MAEPIDPEERTPAELFWEGDSLEAARGFPKSARRELGEDIERARRGLKPSSFRPMPSIGKGVAELKQRDESGWYRTIYLGVIDGKLHILHCFIKKSGKTPKNDLAIAQARLKAVRVRLQEARRDGKRKDLG